MELGLVTVATEIVKLNWLSKNLIPKKPIIVKNMSKATTIKEALKRWEDREQQNCLDAKSIDLQFQWPPIEKMDATLGTLVNCE